MIVSKKEIRQELAITQIADSILNQYKIKVQVHYLTRRREFANSNSALVEDIKNEGINVLG